ncbi:TetR/AcrR family transcriptional regulator [Spongiactinospora sp. TRM90649]|uniref:TetR/AcrR family transcriptional regulator n=1 Tax=Spongiactinospora sp. TRM90649 TaxID=3031114 RepID=UPI0023F82BBA|nr:TetR/AcrR family transcriptional regulator [Spongiactinospora sp. TRM90649]MDF5757699.1 helix-turn-helix domain containing protein [Spongiactinospora sp. TRM90649]
MRADARDNRDRILRAAREAYCAHGIDVPLTAIARRAGVGVATLYRRFPTRAALVSEAFAEQLTVCAAVLDDALADPDAWRGFRSMVEKVCAMQAADRGFTAAFLARFPGDPAFERARESAEARLTELVRRAKATGRLRPDFEIVDLMLLFRAIAGLVDESPALTLASSRRLVAYLLQAFESGRHAPLPPPAPLDLRRIALPAALSEHVREAAPVHLEPLDG